MDDIDRATIEFLRTQQAWGLQILDGQYVEVNSVIHTLRLPVYELTQDKEYERADWLSEVTMFRYKDELVIRYEEYLALLYRSTMPHVLDFLEELREEINTYDPNEADSDAESCLRALERAEFIRSAFPGYQGPS